MVVSDKTYIDPADFFDPESPRPERSIFAKYWTMVVFPTAAVLSVCGGNYAARRPYFAGQSLQHLGCDIVYFLLKLHK